MAPRRSARVSAAALKEASKIETPTDIKQKTEKPKELKKKGGITKTKSEPKTQKKTVTAAKKKAIAAAIADVDVDVDVTPSTPKRNQKTSDSSIQRPTDVPPSLPPPFVTPRRTANNAPDLNRPIDPHRTTATLLTPRGSHITAYPADIADASPSKTGLPRPTTTVGNLLDDAIAHLLSVDTRMKAVIDKFPDAPFKPADLAVEIDPFQALVSGIIGQQVSGAAAKSIKKKFIALFNPDSANGSEDDGDKQQDGEGDSASDAGTRYNRVPFPSPQQVVTFDLPTLRTAGLSQRKAEYIHGLAEKFASGELSARMLLTATDEEVLEKLIAVRGLGKWSVEMFLLFGLKRMDVFSTGDLGVQRGMAAYVGRDISKLKAKGGGKFKYMAEKDMVEIAAPFSPYRSLFMWYMWRWENVDVAVMQA
ncbi:DNA-3-methyladenine glycosylase [Arthroderma uncinatum]|uniref:DNA-3-methyladenine glycosylase n=1 Tax=Arthroderma uncinatum TaxID=74035 RepID=UPI00144AEA74|nr:DNA-3-methyladenine glycosylase [Arthroderma uncinatum]KAF3491923.1 DNA-3-methyladenine glycosylase [Arthroderma uncinatum]